MSKRPVLNVLVLIAALVIGAGPYVVRAAGLKGGSKAEWKAPCTEDQKDPCAVANVDMTKVYDESEAKVQAVARTRAFAEKAETNFGEVAKLQFVTFNEINDFSVAINTPNPTAAQTKSLTDIRAADASRTTEYQTLTSKKQADLTAQDTKRLRELNTMLQQRPSILDRLQKLYQSSIEEEETKHHRQGMAEIRAAVQKLAKDQGIAQVFDMSVLVHAPTDLTDQAAKKLKAKGK